ncbi:MAG: DNA-protecting protein DprA [Candidatus Brennerbacteria bacterium]|nr:DNA-protecting protein DprA [Candidatus Brennerbacteria bacterium]
MSSPINKINLDDENFPHFLREIPGPPAEIFYKGRLPQKNEIMVAVVGTRKATNDGLTLAKRLGYGLAEAGITVVSGLAFGVDAAAHSGTLLAGGRTIAVLANGLEPVQPSAHHGLAEKILNQDGCIISEFAESGAYYKGLLLERNRLISGLCVAMVVVEAPIRSGSLSTARHALNQGREVFVAPGPAGHPNYEGSHMLLRNGARLVTSAKEILEDLQLEQILPTAVGTPTKVGAKIDDETQLAIFKTIQEAAEPLHIDNIVETTKLDPTIVNQKLTDLMLEGLVEERNGKFKVRN